MEEGKGGDDGDYFAGDSHSASASPPLPVVPPSSPQSDESERKHGGEKPKRNVTPRAQLFSDLGRAHREITSRQGISSPFRNASGDSTPSLSDRNYTASSTSFGKPIVDAYAALPQDDSSPLPTILEARQPPFGRCVSSSSSSPAIHPLSEIRHHDFDFDLLTQGSGLVENPFEDDAGRLDGFGGASVAAQSDDQDAADTIEAPLSGPDSSFLPRSLSVSGLVELEAHSLGREGAAGRCGFREEESEDLRRRETEICFLERRTNSRRPSSQPPAWRLETPSAVKRSTSTLEILDEFSPFDSSVTDSQQLLDADLQVDKIRNVHNSLMPLPLRLPSDKEAFEYEHDEHDEHDKQDDGLSSIADPSTGSNDDPFMYDNEMFKSAMLQPLERDISRALETTTTPAAAFTSNVSKNSQVAVPPTSSIGSDLASESAQNPQRTFRIVISRESHADPNNGDSREFHAQNARDFQLPCPVDITSEKDWVTETSSDGGHGTGTITSTQSRGFPRNTIKKTGESVAGYSSDGGGEYEAYQASRMRQGRVLQHPVKDTEQTSFQVHQVKNSEQPVILPKRNNAVFHENTCHIYARDRKDAVERKVSTNPFVRATSKRNGLNTHLFKVDSNVTSKYDFRDSFSDYSPSLLQSNEATFGTGQTNEHQTTPSPGQPTPIGFRSSRIVDPQHVTTPGLYPYGNTSTPISPISNHAFSLVPLDEARRRNKLQRESGETDETDTLRERALRRARNDTFSSTSSALVHTPIQQPKKAHVHSDRVVATGLSLDFTPPDWDTMKNALRDASTPYGPSPEEDSIRMSTLLRHATHESPTARLFVSKRPRKSTAVPQVREYSVEPSEAAVYIPPEEFISRKARNARKIWFICMLVMSTLPFFAILILSGKMNPLLSWATSGEVKQISKKEKTIVKYVFIAEVVVYAISVAVLITYSVQISTD